MLLIFVILGLVTHSLGGGSVPSKCQPQVLRCGKNEVYVVNDNACRKTCANRNYVNAPNAGACKPFTGCVCKRGYMRINDDATGRCVKENKCPPAPCKPKCGVNEVAKKERTICPPQTCQSIYIKYRCAPTKPDPGCDCIEGYLRNSNGTCIPRKDCPPIPTLPICGKNEVATTNKIICPPQTCESIYALYKCAANIEPQPGCNCIDGYLRNRNGTCIPSEQCPPPLPVCGENEVATNDKIICPPQSCESIYTSYLCVKGDPEPGCNCIDGYLRNRNGTCIPSEQCPPLPTIPICGKNEVATSNKIICPPQTCESIYTLYKCATNIEPQPGCNCIDGYLRNRNGTCIPSEQCPPPLPVCGENEVATDDKIICPPQSCESIYTSYFCEKRDPEPGCNCIDGYLRDSNGTCIPNDQCPPRLPVCGENEVATANRIICPPQSCESIYTTYLCEKRDPEPGCNCIDGYLRDSNGTCIPNEQCPTQSQTCGINEVWAKEKVGCPPETCTSLYYAIPCAPRLTQLPPGCVCKKNYLRDENGTCIPVDQCPPRPEPQPVCGSNEVWSDNKIICPPQSCASIYTSYNCVPRDPEPGCNCIDGYLRNSDGICIPSEKCPPPQTQEECGYNEVWTQTKVKCPPQTCESQYMAYPCANLPPEPGCVCISDHLRNSSGICIPKELCPPQPIPSQPIGCNGDPNAVTKKCPSQCPPSCENPNPSGFCTKICLVTGCECNPGYLRSGDKCVLPKDCPANKGCNGDPNATVKTCPNPCPATCSNQNPVGVCPRACLVAGCECNKGYVLNNGTCVLPKNCPAVQCPVNEQYVNCKVECPNSYCPVNDIRAILICDPPYPCPSGCVCKSGYFRKSRQEPYCIEASKCPPVNCTRPNEVWNPSPPACLRERCEDAKKQSEPCNNPYRDYKPRCVCRNGFYRNASDICVPAIECPFECPIEEKCRPTCAVPRPKNCPITQPAEKNINGCQCAAGYILSEARGKCIKIEECPQNQGCNGDPHAIVKDCPSSCPPTCCQPDNRCVNKKCSPPDCQCAPGYILSEENGKCILPGDCKGGDPCGPNGTYVECSYRCPENYCPKDDSRDRPVCDPIYPCRSGCICKLNHKRLNNADERCIVSSDCPPVNCTRPNEVWSPCPSACLAENCVNVSDRPSVCNTLVLNCDPRCICADGYFRNSTTDLCIPAEECVANNPCLSKCTPTCAQPNPPCDNPPANQCCKDGYILSERGGQCIRVEECPKGCNGDPYALVKKCPKACPATCEQPDNIPCTKNCLVVGCQCAPGYILSGPNGKCIPANQCPGGDPCGPNGTFVSCAFGCPDQYCPQNDNNAQVACLPPLNCPPGCACKLNHKRLSYEDKRCILSSDCPPVNCTRPNEVWSSCPSGCLAENCENVNDAPSVCNTLVLNCQPKCICQDGYYRNSSGICIAATECPGYNPCQSKCTPTCAQPNPPCANSVKNKCCLDGYILSETNGTCIKIEDCPKDIGCNGDPHALVKKCPFGCPPTCDRPNVLTCTKACLAVGCQCAPGYILSGINGKCIPGNQCPGGDPCLPNGTFVSCVSGCPDQYCPRNDNNAQVACMPPRPEYCISGCACKPNHKFLSNKDKRCILSSDCPPVNCTRPNEVWSPCPSPCLVQNCRNIFDPPGACNTLVLNCQPKCICKDGYYRNNNGICVPVHDCEGYDPCQSKCTPTCAQPNPPNCINPKQRNCCEKGYILSERNGKCIKIEDCPKDIGCNGDPHALVKKCPFSCQATCDNPDIVMCAKECLAVGCECAQGYLLSKHNGKCILPNQCPGGDPCGPNGTFVGCVFRCPTLNCPRDDSNLQPECLPPRDCMSGCICNSNYRRLTYKDSKCILASDCPPVNCTRPNEVWSSCPSACLAENCENINDPPSVCKTQLSNCQPKCICRDGHYRNSSGICVPANECNSCGRNETYVSCRFRCPIQYCPKDDRGIQYACKPPRNCPPGCGCKPNYKRLSIKDDRCILASDCPPVNCTRPNEVWSSCPSECLAENCENVNDAPSVCNTLVSNCQPKCICQDGYYRNSSGICIAATECPGYNPCQSKCTPTCAQPNPPCANSVKNKCCLDGYILSETNGTCIKIEDCPKDIGCNGDPHALVKKCPLGCPNTCEKPDILWCTTECLPVGCQCAPGYLLSGLNGKCILANQCPGGDPCGPNGTFVSCVFRCPTLNCPRDDSNLQPACIQPRDCMSGCACKPNYKQLSYKDSKCILASDCPPVNCTRPNEVWSSCPSACLAENCENINDPPRVCNTLLLNCQPKCICRDGYYRNSSGICIPANECEGNPCQSKCAPTCAQPNPPDCDNPPQKDCCAKGYVLSERNGKCIKIEDCPIDIGCNGDPHAIIKQCAPPCPSTCAHPELNPCKRVCLPIGCQCAPGYVLSKTGGKCVLADQCPGGNPCGPNGTYASCGFRCPNQYCPRDDSRIQIACKPSRDCPPGCVCKLNHKRLSEEDDRCILSSDCPPVNCTRPNEVWSSCPSDCLAESCANVNDKPSVCNTLVLDCQPNCICQEGYYRNSDDICVPAEECPGYNPCQSKCTPTCAQPNPPCAKSYNGDCCKDGYILSEWNGKCIKVEDCPINISCNGDPNAVVKKCPAPCPSTCNRPNAIPCRKACLPVGCECAPGYIKSDDDGTCIRPDECPGGNPCGKNEMFVQCRNNCPSDYCPVDDSRAVVDCSYPCLSGCICRPNYRRKSLDDQQCILSSDCPPVKCTRQNEEWSPCPSPCLRDSCQDVGKKPEKCNTLLLNCQPQCVCCKNYYRNSTGICVTPEQCSDPC